jgi:hypothetical protein
MFKKITLLVTAAAFIGILLASCASNQTIEEGWVDENTYQVTVVGSVSNKKAGTKLRREALAKEAAKLRGIERIIEKFKGIMLKYNAGVSNAELTGSAIYAELNGKVQGGAIYKTVVCETTDEETSCKVLYRVSSPNLQKKTRMKIQ